MREGERLALGVGGKRLLTLVANPEARAVAGATGLYHLAVLLPDRRSLARLIYHLAENEIEVAGVADHGVSEAIYLSDQDGNGIEMYSDRRKKEWPRDDIGKLQMGTEELDLDNLLLELRDGVTPFEGLSEGTVVGHIHLRVANLPETERFYRQILGFDLTTRYGGAAMFFSAGGYHHHVGANTWAGVGAPPPPPGSVGLRWFEIVLPGQEALGAVLTRLKAAGWEYEEQAEGVFLRDPSANGILLTTQR
jgi:catechol 2,3-dioxygenase